MHGLNEWHVCVVATRACDGPSAGKVAASELPLATRVARGEGKWVTFGSSEAGLALDLSRLRPLAHLVLSIRSLRFRSTQETRSSVADVLMKALSGQETANFSLPLLSKHGQRYTVLLNATTRRDAKGEVTGVVGVGQDITELNQVMAESKRVADDLMRLIETANAPIFGIDTNGNVTEWNAKARAGY